MNGKWIPCGRNSSCSFIPILSKLHWCFVYGLKIQLYTCGLDIILRLFFVTFSQVELGHFSSIFFNKVSGQAQLLQFYTDSFETLLVFWSWSENMRVV